MKETGTNNAVVTDHAVLRYIERKHGVDVEAIRLHIRNAVADGVRYGASGVIAEGVKFVLQQDTVVTCLKKDWKSRNSSQRAEE